MQALSWVAACALTHPVMSGAGKSVVATDVLWSDPSNQPGLMENEARGVGLLFGPDITQVCRNLMLHCYHQDWLLPCRLASSGSCTASLAISNLQVALGLSKGCMRCAPDYTRQLKLLPGCSS